VGIAKRTSMTRRMDSVRIQRRECKATSPLSFVRLCVMYEQLTRPLFETPPACDDGDRPRSCPSVFGG
jgi:hypothetical protein